MASPPELPGDLPSNFADAFWYAIYVLGGGVAWFLTKHGLTKPADKPGPTATVSAALVDNRVVDPLALKIEANTSAVERLCDLMEQEVGLRRSHVEEERRAEERKAMALAVADQVREDILSELRAEIQRKEPAKMPNVRKPPA